ncbi:hypothetical protein SAMN05444166_0276 [Singulisphaera sp. GP187]|uniref:hypothetical protein n=1 Tax=Singulisphaera sp. GP187 TaxID=1882752 RepID=UPI00092B335B|nr:hypothetical protein [Singulisphaera sp. GP187]SIN70580.1 hypothetical protein SAMN05444166_0276 [Singulisphaera sp. GP187]
MKLPRVKPGDPITDTDFNRLIDAANQCNLSVGQGGSLNMIADPDGYVLDAVTSEPIWGKVTGPLASGTYPFTEQFPDSGGTWTAGTLTDVAYEVEGNTSVATNTYIQLWRSASGDWRFLAGTC